jgi:hypothetical protein
MRSKAAGVGDISIWKCGGSWRSLAIGVASLAVVGGTAMVAASPAMGAGTSVTWTGKASAKSPSQPGWSLDGNRKGGVSPNATSPAALVFPVLPCTTTGPWGISSVNDITGLTVSKVTLRLSGTASGPQPGDDGISGNGITLDGLTVTTGTLPSTDVGQFGYIELPISLGGVRPGASVSSRLPISIWPG